MTPIIPRTTRRDFLAQAAAISAVAALPETSFASPNDRMKVAFIGTGGRGGSNLQTISKSEGVDVVGLCDVDSRFLTSAGNKFPKAKQFQDFRKLYDDIGADVDAVVVPDAGEVLFRGKPISRDYAQRIGIQFQSTALQDFLTVRESLELFATLYHEHLPLEQLIEDCSLNDFIDRDNRKLSGGQRQRLLLAIALVNDPDLIFLDEPTTGLDPQARRHFWELIERIKARGKSILLTTHYMDEAEFLCDEIAIVDSGSIVEQGTPRELLAKHFDGSLIKLPAGTDLSSLNIPSAVINAGDFLQFSTSQVGETVNQLAATGIPLDGLRIESPTLEDLFLLLTGHSLRA